jgi:hypothetical protein
MNDEQQPEVPAEPTPPPAPARAPDIAAEMEQAVAAFDAKEKSRAARPKPVYTPFSLRDVDRRVWMALFVFVVFVAVSLGGPPWEASFWITLGLSALFGAPCLVGAIFLWQRERS